MCGKCSDLPPGQRYVSKELVCQDILDMRFPLVISEKDTLYSIENWWNNDSFFMPSKKFDRLTHLQCLYAELYDKRNNNGVNIYPRFDQISYYITSVLNKE